MQKHSICNTKRLYQDGFTLIEVIVVVVILGILALVAIPSFRGFTNSSGVTTAANDLITAFNLARSEAVTRAGAVTVCKSADLATCNTTGANWEQGWIVFYDDNGDGTVNAGDDTVLRVFEPQSGNVTMAADANLADRLTYASTGYLASTAANDEIEIVAGNSQVNVEISAMGRVRSYRP